jgi:hypothetical protein
MLPTIGPATLTILAAKPAIALNKPDINPITLLYY